MAEAKRINTIKLTYMDKGTARVCFIGYDGRPKRIITLNVGDMYNATFYEQPLLAAVDNVITRKKIRKAERADKL